MCIDALEIYTNAYMYITKNDEERGCEFEREHGRVYGRVWKDKNNDVIIISKNLRNIFKRQKRPITPSSLSVLPMYKKGCT